MFTEAKNLRALPVALILAVALLGVAGLTTVADAKEVFAEQAFAEQAFAKEVLAEEEAAEGEEENKVGVEPRRILQGLGRQSPEGYCFGCACA